MAGALCYEVGSKLQRLERYGESLWFLERASQKWEASLIMRVECLLLLAKSQVSLNDYLYNFLIFLSCLLIFFLSTTFHNIQVKLSEMEAAEATFYELDSIISPEVERASLEHVHLQVQISLVLLTALLGPPEHNLSPVQSALFERYKGEPDDHMEIEVRTQNIPIN